MPKSRDVLDAQIDALALAMPQLLADAEPEFQIDAFAGRADEIMEAAGPEDRDHVWSRLQCLLRDNGLIPGDEEPCSDA